MKLLTTSNAAWNWFQFLTKGILAEGYTQSAINLCFQLCHDCFRMVYTDDCLIFAKDDGLIDTIIHNMYYI
jgi:hypothetical protein